MSAASVRAAAPRGDLRLTCRGRLVLLAVFVGVLFAALSVWTVRSAAVSAGPQPEPVRTVVAEAGDTLWDIAVATRPAADPRATIEAILELNGELSGPVSLQVGQRVAVPAA